MMHNKKNQNGFTLIEIAVVLVIVGVLVGSFIGTFADRIDTTRQNNTKKELEEIKQVVMAFVYSGVAPYALPCPDSDIPPNGIADVDGAGNCDAGAAVGTLPWITLGMGQEDDWGTRYSYWVDTNYANNVVGFDLATGNGGSAQIDTRINNNQMAMAANAVVVIFSRGKNGLGGVSIEGVNRDVIPALGNDHDDELENADGDVIFMSRFTTDEGVAAAGGAFDDILIWVSAFELKAKMVEAGALP